MNRREFMRLNLAASGALTAGGARAAPRPGAADDVAEVGIAELQAAMQAGRTTSRGLVRAYLARIRAIDRAGPRINSIIELNPEAQAIAAALDRERRSKGPRGPLHGVPVVLKDNIATADRMHTTAGSLALVEARAPRDAFVVQRLRAAGAVILGKANLSEWANFRSTRSTSGWSARGGLTRNPYALDRNPSGSSSGSAAAIASSLAAAALGTETDGSIVSPSSANGLVGIKPTLGLVSRDGIVPIAHSQDTAGPMARSVADAAALLSAIAGADPRDAATAEAGAYAVDFTRFLDRDGLRGARIGVVRANFGGRNDLVGKLAEDALEVMRAQGAVLFDPVEVPNAGKYGQSELEVLLHELKADMQAYLAEFAAGSGMASLKDLIDFNDRHASSELRYFGQEHFIAAHAKGGLDTPAYREALENNRRYSRAEGLDLVLGQQRLDALVAPTGGPAWLTDFIRGDASGGGFTSPAAVAGYPHVTVPAGFVHGLPCGLSFVGGAWSEPTLIRLAYSFEQASGHRRAPTYPRSVNLGA